MNYDTFHPSILARGAEKLNTNKKFLKEVVRWVAELPSREREELFETVKNPMCGTPRQ
jgi:hypothetical protein